MQIINKMKNFFILIFFFQISLLPAQNTIHWRAVYQYKKMLTEKEKARRDSLINIQPEYAERLKNFYKRTSNRTYFLDFNRNESVYKIQTKLSGGEPDYFITRQNNNILYKNLKDHKYIDRRSFFEKEFLVTDSLPDYQWKITGETKKIGPYTAIKAQGVEEVRPDFGWRRGSRRRHDVSTGLKIKKKKVYAWFTPEIPISNGPEKYHGLPGLILEIDRDGEVYFLKELVINPKEYNSIKPPEKGKKISEKEYFEMQKKEAKKREKMYRNSRGENNYHHHRMRM